MTDKINRLLRPAPHKDTNGQTALILILLTAVALIFLAITLNWGRVAQSKSLLTIGADQAAALLASDAASYGEMQKQGSLKDENKLTHLSGILLDVIEIGIAIFVAVISFTGIGAIAGGVIWAEVLAVVAAVMAIGNLVLQLAVVNPGITSLWNSLQKNQPIQQQFYEQGISTALQGTVTDQVNITDYLDWNANGQFGNTNKLPNDTVGRFALFYSDRLKMLNLPLIPQVVFFYNQLGELINGETCAQNASDHSLYPALIPINSACTAAGVDCTNTPSDPDCQLIIPGTTQLNNACTPNSDTSSPNYTPYCDPCCQPASVPDPSYSSTTFNPLHTSPTISIRPSNCPQPVNGDDSQDIKECQNNNPYNSAPGSNDSPYPLLYDPTYQNYNSTTNASFLSLFGRDQQEPLPASALNPAEPPFTPLIIQGDFPDGIYPFFWLDKDYSLEVDTITPAPNQSQYHWCTSAVPAPAPYYPPNPAVLAKFPELTQLSLPYACQGQDCCVGPIGGTILGTGSSSYVAGGPNVPAPVGTTSAVIDKVGAQAFGADLAHNSSFGEGGSGTWLEGDNQFCSNENGIAAGQCADGTSCTPASTCASDGSVCSYGTYNGSSSAYPDGSCEWTNTITTAPAALSPSISTVDNLDDTVHTLSNFVRFSNAFLSEDVGTLSANFSAWYPQVAQWVAPTCASANTAGCNSSASCVDSSGNASQCPANGACADGSACGAPEGSLISVSNNLKAWGGPTGVVASWLGISYADNGAWCVPSGSTGSPNEDAAISGGGPWGTLPSVIACLNYNATTPATLYQTCLSALESQNSSTCSLPSSCTTTVLGRSLAQAPINPFEASSKPPAATSEPPAYPSCSTGVSSDCTVNSYISTTPPSTVPGPDGTITGTNITNQNIALCPYSYTQSGECSGCPSTDPTCTSAYNPSGTCTSCSKTGTCTSYSTATCDPKTCGCGLVCTSTITATCQEAPPSGPSTTTTFESTSCDPTQTGSFANWVQNSLTLATDEAPKFALRSQYLSDIYARAEIMQTIFTQGGLELQSFLNGPAAQLMSASQTQPTANLPNSVIYGWQDNPPSSDSGGCTDSNGKRVGCSHLVKVTAYSPGRNVGNGLNGLPVLPSLPYIKTSSGFFTRSYTLDNRDGYVYVSVKRWDEDHSTPTNFPNNHPLWQFLFHNPTANATTTGSGLIGACQGLSMTTNDHSPIGFGLEPVTVQGLEYNGQISQADQTALGQAFMLNDEGDGKVDPANAGSSGSCTQGSASPYCQCLSAANQLLASAPESHACAQYIASINASRPSPDEDHDYSLKFVKCPSIPSDDLTGGKQ